jgi:hypothetical protein
MVMIRSKPPIYGGEYAGTSGTRMDGTPSRLSLSLIEAYEKTRFRVMIEQPFDLYVDRQCPELARLIAWHGVMTAGIITACNPRSRIADAAENVRRQADLVARLDMAGFQHLPVFGHDPDGKWPGEESRLVLGIGEPDIATLGRVFDQNAVVLAGTELATPELLLLR